MNYELVWKKYDGTLIKNVSDYVKNWTENHIYGSVTIGCDSQEHSKYIKYSVSICMHDVDESGIGHGAHVIFASFYDKDKNMKTNIYTKLWAEAEISVEAALQLKDCKMKIMVHLDYSSDENRYSNILYKAGIGYVKGMGFDALGKPHAWAATHVGDSLCKNKQAAGM